MKPDYQVLQALDQKLITELTTIQSKKKYFTLGEKRFRNEHACKHTQSFLNGSKEPLRSWLEESDVLDIKTDSLAWEIKSSNIKELKIARAAHTDMWPMGTHFWLRDNVIIAARLLNLQDISEGKPLDFKRGKQMLLSSLELLSTSAQLARFKAIIKKPELAEDAHNWPHIFLDIKNNLAAEKVEPWMHIQDAWQQCVFYTLLSLEKGLLKLGELEPQHKELLSMVVPFLMQTEFYRRENAGSWEEITSLRSSVLAWEIAILEKIDRSKDSFLLETLSFSYKNETDQAKSFKETVNELLSKGLESILEQLPFESPNYSPDSPKYRQADAALMYVLQLDIPGILARRGYVSEQEVNSLENKILIQVMSLCDPVTFAIRRYLNDSYQRSGYFRNTSVAALNDLYGGASGEASETDDFSKRSKIVPAGREAAWVHFVWQVCAYAGRRFNNSQEEFWKSLQIEMFTSGMSLITGDDEYTLSVNEKGESEIISVAAARIPECYISEAGLNDKPLVFPSPHTPLNWAVAEACDALNVLLGN